MAATPPILELRGITKRFPGIVANDHIDLDLRQGEVHALLGENGAGKSTLMKVLSGVHPHGDYDGDIVYDGQVRRFAGIHDSERAGIIIIHQELALVPMLSIAENLFLGNEIARHGVIDGIETQRRTRALLERVGLRLSPETPVGDLGVGQQQLEAVDLRVQQLGRARGRRGERPALVVEHVAGEADRRERRAQLVRHVADEALLHPRQLGQLRDLPLHRAQSTTKRFD